MKGKTSNTRIAVNVSEQSGILGTAHVYISGPGVANESVNPQVDSKMVFIVYQEVLKMMQRQPIFPCLILATNILSILQALYYQPFKLILLNLITLTHLGLLTQRLVITWDITHLCLHNYMTHTLRAVI